jgi:AcrR family transcriptional regulator
MSAEVSKDTGMKRRLLDAAEIVINDKGYQGARVSDIVGQAGVAQGSFYLHFDNKKAVYLELIDGFFSHLLDATLGQHPVAQMKQPADMRAQIHAIWSTLVLFCRSHPMLTRLVLEAQSALPLEDRERLNQHFESIAETLSHYLRATSAAGLTKPLDADLMGWVVLGMIERALYFAVFVAPDARAEDLANDLTAFELSGLLAPMAESEEGRAP